MVLLTMTSALVDALQTRPAPDPSPALNQDASHQEPSLRNPAVGNPITHAQIIDVWKGLGTLGNASISLEQLLVGAKIYVPPPAPKPEPTDEFKALMARLRRDEEERSYARMTEKLQTGRGGGMASATTAGFDRFAEANRPTNAADMGDDSIELGDVQRQMTLLLNFLISIAGCAVALWLAARWWSTPARLFLSMGGALVVGIAEVAVYSAYTWRMAEGNRKEENKKEVRRVVKTWVVGEEEKEGVDGHDATPCRDLQNVASPTEAAPELLDKGESSGQASAEGNLRRRAAPNGET